MTVRPAGPADAPAMTAVLNGVLRLGPALAHHRKMTAGQVADHYLSGADVLSAVVDEEDSAIQGWQSVGWWQGEAHIGTFLAPGALGRGVGQRLFALTCHILQGGPVSSVMASVRADDAAGLAYYARIGFAEVAADALPRDGRGVGRVHRRFDLV